MKFSTLDILSIHRGLPALVERLLTTGEVKRAFEVSGVIRKFQPEVEVFRINEAALLNAYGEEERGSQNKVIVATSKGFQGYIDAYQQLMEQEHEINVDLIPVTTEEIQGMHYESVIQISPMLVLKEQT